MRTAKGNVVGVAVPTIAAVFKTDLYSMLFCKLCERFKGLLEQRNIVGNVFCGVSTCGQTYCIAAEEMRVFDQRFYSIVHGFVVHCVAVNCNGRDLATFNCIHNLF